MTHDVYYRYERTGYRLCGLVSAANFLLLCFIQSNRRHRLRCSFDA